MLDLWNEEAFMVIMMLLYIYNIFEFQIWFFTIIIIFYEIDFFAVLGYNISI